MPRLFGLVARRNRDVQPQHVRLRLPGEVLEAGDDAGGDAGEQDREQVGPVRVQGGEVREHAGIEHGQQLGQLGPSHVLRVVLVPVRGRRVPAVLATHRHDDLVEERVAETRDLHERSDAHIFVVVAHERLLAVGRCPDADGRVARHYVGGLVALRVSRLIGTWMASVCTLNARKALMPAAAGVGIRCRFWNGRSAARSKTAPRST